MVAVSTSDLRRELVSERFRAAMKEHKMRVRDLFLKMDLDKDGTLTRKEFCRGVRQLKLPFTRVELNDIFDSFDQVADGRIEFKELFKGVRAQRLGRHEINRLVDMEREIEGRRDASSNKVTPTVTPAPASSRRSEPRTTARTVYTASTSSSRSSLGNLSLGGRVIGRREALVQRLLALEGELEDERQRASQTRKAMVALHQRLEESVLSKPRRERRVGRDKFFGRRGSDLTRISEEQGKSRFSAGCDWGRSEYFPRRSCEIVQQVANQRLGKQAVSNLGDGADGEFRRKRTDLTKQAEALCLFQRAQRQQHEAELRRREPAS